MALTVSTCTTPLFSAVGFLTLGPPSIKKLAALKISSTAYTCMCNKSSLGYRKLHLHAYLDTPRGITETWFGSISRVYGVHRSCAALSRGWISPMLHYLFLPEKWGPKLITSFLVTVAIVYMTCGYGLVKLNIRGWKHQYSMLSIPWCILSWKTRIKFWFCYMLLYEKLILTVSLPIDGPCSILKYI